MYDEHHTEAVTYKGDRFYFTGLERRHLRGRKPKTINKIDINTHKVIATYPSIATASKETGIIRSSIIHCLKGRYSQAGGYFWEYA